MGDTLSKLKERQKRAAEKVEQELARQRQLDGKIRKQEKAVADAKAFTLGRAVLAEIEHDKHLAKTIGSLLDKVLKLPRERALFGLKIIEPAAETAPVEEAQSEAPAVADIKDADAA